MPQQFPRQFDQFGNPIMTPEEQAMIAEQLAEHPFSQPPVPQAGPQATLPSQALGAGGFGYNQSAGSTVPPSRASQPTINDYAEALANMGADAWDYFNKSGGPHANVQTLPSQALGAGYSQGPQVTQEPPPAPLDIQPAMSPSALQNAVQGGLGALGQGLQTMNQLPQMAAQNERDQAAADVAKYRADAERRMSDPDYAAGVVPLTPQEQQAALESKMRTDALKAKLNEQVEAEFQRPERLSINERERNAVNRGLQDTAGNFATMPLNMAPMPEQPAPAPGFSPQGRDLRGREQVLADFQEKQARRAAGLDRMLTLDEALGNVPIAPAQSEEDRVAQSTKAMDKWRARNGLYTGDDKKLKALSDKRADRKDRTMMQAQARSWQRRGASPLLAQALAGTDPKDPNAVMERINAIRDPRGAAAAKAEARRAKNEERKTELAAQRLQKEDERFALEFEESKRQFEVGSKMRQVELENNLRTARNQEERADAMDKFNRAEAKARREYLELTAQRDADYKKKDLEIKGQANEIMARERKIGPIDRSRILADPNLTNAAKREALHGHMDDSSITRALSGRKAASPVSTPEANNALKTGNFSGAGGKEALTYLDDIADQVNAISWFPGEGWWGASDPYIGTSFKNKVKDMDPNVSDAAIREYVRRRGWSIMTPEEEAHGIAGGGLTHLFWNPQG